MNAALLAPAPRRFARPLVLALAGALALAGLLATSSPAQAAELKCPATFHVLHDDRVGQLQLPAGHYEITLLNAERMSCSRASNLFREFLEDFDGNLPGRWRVIARRAEFRWANSQVGFRVHRVAHPSGGGGGGRHPATGRACPAPFTVLHNDHIGRLSLPRGQYRITLLAQGRLSCQRASRLFARFLRDFDGNLPGRWRLDVATATFSRNHHVGFRVKHVGGGHGGGHRHPGGNARRCAGTFRVLHNDRIGRLRLPAGQYRITVRRPKRLGCSRAATLFRRFLQDFEGNLPGHWRVKPRTGTFLRGQSGVGFRVKLVRRVGLTNARLRRIIGGIADDVFIGKGIGPRQLFRVPASALTVDEAGRGPRSFASGISNLRSDRRLELRQVQPVGSMTKVVTATLVMQQVEAGRLDLDQTVPEIADANDGDGGVLRELVDEYRERLRDVTLRELLTHTSGLADFLETVAFARAFNRDPLREWTLAETTAIGLEAPPVFPPGAPGKWNYSNTEYTLAGMVFEAVSGETVGEGMQRLFDQAGMESSIYAPSPAEVRRPPLSERLIHGYFPPTPEGTTLPPVDQLLLDTFEGAPRLVATLGRPRAVKAVSTNPNQSGPTVQVRRARGKRAERAARKRRYRYQDVTHAYAFSWGGSAGAIVANSEDLARFWRALFDGELVEPETLREMQRTVPTGENSRGVRVRWGLGFGEQRIKSGVFFKGSPALTVWYHLGDGFGYAAAGYYVEQEDLVVANTVSIWPQPIGDLGLLRNVVRAYVRSPGG
jgi:CubicO group peptidase (beta-lactamase class C family)